MKEISTAFLNKTINVVIDRPLGSRHPEWGFDYPVNYGYISGVLVPDGEDLDAYVLGVDEAVDSFEGVCLAVIHRTNDRDDKLIIVPHESYFTDDEIRGLTNFQEQFFESVILRM